MIIIGDIHGKFDKYFKICQATEDFTLQLGDFGFGFGTIPDKWNEKDKLFPGNHDCPDVALPHPNCLGRWGVYNGVFYISGAYSIDQAIRKQWEKELGQKFWWENEEIPTENFEAIVDIAKQIKPEVIVSHDCPGLVRSMMIGNGPVFMNRTADNLLNTILAIIKPKMWVFGHYHASNTFMFQKCEFHALAELETFKL
jgi:hypothetical protein